DHDCSSHGYVVHGAAHGLRGHVVGKPAVAFPHGAGGSNGGSFDYAKESGGKIAFNVFAKSSGFSFRSGMGCHDASMYKERSQTITIYVREGNRAKPAVPACDFLAQ